MNLLEVAGHLVVKGAAIEKGVHGISITEVIGNLTIRNANLEQQHAMMLQQVHILNEQRNAKQAELARLNGTSVPEPVKLGDEEKELGLDQLDAHIKALTDSNKALDELLAAHKAKDAKAATEGTPTVTNTEPETPKPIEDGQVYDGRG